MKVKSEFSVEKWDEKHCGEPMNDMLTARASVIYTAIGDINGRFNVEYLLHYTNYDAADQHNAVATYIGYLTFSGSVNGRNGAFVLEDKGIYTPNGPASEMIIKTNTGTDDFKGISGSGRYFAEGEKMIMEIDFSV